MSSSTTNERRLELEQKKQRLAELKLQRQQRDATRGYGGSTSAVANGEAAPSAGRATMSQQELDELLLNVGIQPGDRALSPQRPSASGGAAGNRVDGSGTVSNGGLRPTGPSMNMVAGRPSTLEIHSIHPISIAPKNAGAQQAYCKTTQTDDERVSIGEFSMGSQELAFDDEISEMEADDSGTTIGGGMGGGGGGAAPFDDSPTREIRKHLTNLQFHSHGGSHASHGTMTHSTMAAMGHSQHPSQSQQLQQAAAAAAKIPELSEEEKRQILSSAEFNSFFQHKAKVIERALAEDVDIFIDYINGPVSEADKSTQQGSMLTPSRTFHLDSLTTGRSITALDFSNHYPELLAVAYDRCNSTSGAVDATSGTSATAATTTTAAASTALEGLVCVWNTRFHNQLPEMVFHSSSRITAMIFDSYQANIVIGGCYSGQLCLWDTRSAKKGPVCKTLLSNNAHTQPVLCMRIVGSLNAHDLVTLSSDGRMCSWSADNLQTPIDSVNLMCKAKRQITALCMAFFHSNINNFVIGSEESELYVGDRHGSKGEMIRSFPAHSMPINAVDLHRATGAVDFSPLCLTGSLDFGVRLWNLKDQSQPAPQPLISLDRRHKMGVCEVQWSPVHPAVFVSASMDGELNLWNLNSNTENPITTLQVECSINKVLWSMNGQQLVVAGNSGRVHLFDVHESLSSPKASEWDDLANTLAELKLAAGEDLPSSTIT